LDGRGAERVVFEGKKKVADDFARGVEISP
jgi:hypothetical protein